MKISSISNIMTKRTFGLVVVLSLLTFFVSTPVFAHKHRCMSRHGFHSPKIRVMTRNLYLGADIMRVVKAAVENPDNPMAVPVAVAGVFNTVQQTDFPARAEKIADEILFYRPDLIGLQEVSTWLIQEQSDFMLGNPQAADQVVYDYLAILMNALEERGLHYKVAAVVKNADIELPMFAGMSDENLPMFSDLRLVDHDVVLARQRVDVSNLTTGNYKYNVSMEIGGVPVEFTRGYILLDADVRGMDYRFVNTHLEVGSEAGPGFAAIQAAQMAELLEIIGEESKPVVMVGDFNSSPEDPETQPYYQALAAGYQDAWDENSAYCITEGFTCCFNETLDDIDAQLTTRIDHIFIKPGNLEIRKIKARTMGDMPWDMTYSGLWPSDHAGVVAKIKFRK